MDPRVSWVGQIRVACAKIEIYAAKAAAASDSVNKKQTDHLPKLVVRILTQVKPKVNIGIGI